MGMTLIGLERLADLKESHRDCSDWIDHWVREVRASDWKSPQDIKDRYASASFLADRIVVFNVKGNSYRLVVQVAFAKKVVVIKMAGTHADYDKWNKSRS